MKIHSSFLNWTHTAGNKFVVAHGWITSTILFSYTWKNGFAEKAGLILQFVLLLSAEICIRNKPSAAKKARFLFALIATLTSVTALHFLHPSDRTLNLYLHGSAGVGVITLLILIYSGARQSLQKRAKDSLQTELDGIERRKEARLQAPPGLRIHPTEGAGHQAGSASEQFHEEKARAEEIAAKLQAIRIEEAEKEAEAALEEERRRVARPS